MRDDWTEFFNKGDSPGLRRSTSLMRPHSRPVPRWCGAEPRLGAMWKSLAEQVSDPKVTTLDVKLLGPSAAREIGTFSLKTKGPTPQEVTGKYVVMWEKVGKKWKLAADIWNDGK